MSACGNSEAERPDFTGSTILFDGALDKSGGLG